MNSNVPIVYTLLVLLLASGLLMYLTRKPSNKARPVEPMREPKKTKTNPKQERLQNQQPYLMPNGTVVLWKGKLPMDSYPDLTISPARNKASDG